MLSIDRDGMSVPVQVDFTDRLTSDSPISARIKHLESLARRRPESESDVARMLMYWEAAAGSGTDIALHILAWLESAAVREASHGLQRAVRDGIHFLTLYITRRKTTDRIRAEHAEFLRSNGFDET